MSENGSIANRTSGRRLSDQVYSDLKQDIIRVVLAPGANVSENLLGRRYGVGKAPIRSALSRLCHEGLVVAVPRSGHVVSAVTIRDVIDLYEVRTIIEPAAASLAAGHVDGDVLKRAAEACVVSFPPDDLDAVSYFLKANSDFHLMIARHSGNQQLTTLIASLLEAAERVRHIAAIAGYLPAKPTKEQHTQVIEALVSGDSEGAARVMEAHIRSGWEYVMGALFSQNRVYDQEVNISRSGGDSVADPRPISADAHERGFLRNGMELRNVYHFKSKLIS